MREAIRERLATDPTLQALLTGGVWATGEISRQKAPEAFGDDKEIEPCALVKVESETPWGPYSEAGAVSARLYVVVYFYQRNGYEVIDEAMERVFTLLQQEKLEDGVWEIAWADDVIDQEDEALGCSMGVSRYVVTRLRG